MERETLQWQLLRHSGVIVKLTNLYVDATREHRPEDGSRGEVGGRLHLAHRPARRLHKPAGITWPVMR